MSLVLVAAGRFSHCTAFQSPQWACSIAMLCLCKGVRSSTTGGWRLLILAEWQTFRFREPEGLGCPCWSATYTRGYTMLQKPFEMQFPGSLQCSHYSESTIQCIFVWFCMCLYICRYLPVSVFVCLHLPASVFIVCIYPYLSIISVCVGMLISVCLCLSVSRSLCLPLLHSLGLCLPACLSVFLSRQSIHLPVCLFCLLSGLPVRTSIHSQYVYIIYIIHDPSIFVCIYPCVSLSICVHLRASAWSLCICVSIYLHTICACT
jgi:hypothetical protein